MTSGGGERREGQDLGMVGFKRGSGGGNSVGMAEERSEITIAGMGGVGEPRGEEFGIEGYGAVVGGDGHSAGGNMLANFKVRRVSANCGLFAGSRLQHCSAIRHMG